MKIKYKNGLERYKHKYPDEEICVWKEMYKDQPRAEGKLRHCQLYCDGLQKTCESYEPLSAFNECEQF